MNIAPLTEAKDDIDDTKENRNDVKDPQKKLIPTLLQDKACFAKDIDQVMMKVQELRIHLEIEPVVQKEMRAKLKRAERAMKKMKEEKKALLCTTGQLM